MAARQQARRKKAPAVKRPAKTAVDLKRENAALKRALTRALERQTASGDETARLLAELREALDQQAAAADVLKLISRSTFDLRPVLDTLAKTAARLCDAEQGTIWRRDGDVFSAVGSFGHSKEAGRFLSESHPGPGRGTLVGRTVLEGRAVHILDARQDPEYTWSEAIARLGFRTMLGVPLLREGVPIGAFSLYRSKVGPFSDRQMDLVATFADQAVIAIENVRLITETREALERQTATAEVLQVINGSPGDLAPVFEAILVKAHGLCGVAYGSLQLYDGARFHAVATHGVSEAFADRLRQGFSLGPNHPSRRLFEGARFAQISDWAEIDDPIGHAAVELAGIRTTLFIPLRKDGRLVGQIAAARLEVRPFTEKEIALLESFAAQAVIAMENARLLGELQQRTGDLEESLEYQTATGDVLQAISRSTFDLQPVLETLIKTAARLCQAEMALVSRREGEVYRMAANCGFPAEFERFFRSQPIAPDRGTMVGRVALAGKVVHVVDVAADPDYRLSEAITLGHQRTALGVPLLREGRPIGVIVLARERVEPFTERQIELVRTFADQAVIAIENTRLLTEQREALEQQTATAEVLQVINGSPGDLAPVFDAMLEKALRLCDASCGHFRTSDGEFFHLVAQRGAPEAYAEVLRTPVRPDRDNPLARMLRGERVIASVDLGDEEPYRAGDPMRRAVVDLGGARSAIQVALIKDGKLLGSLLVYRLEVRPFSDKQIALLQNFAAQAVIAMENARLITETREALAQQTATAEVLRVINSSPGDITPVFDAMLEKAHSLCAVAYGSLQLYDGGKFRAVAVHGLSGAFADRLRQGYTPTEEHPCLPLLEGARFAQIPDITESDDPTARAAFALGGIRTALFVPLRKGKTLLGQIIAARREVRPFNEKEIALLESFAAQAVIAMENARLITETREALEQQTATAEVLQVINGSPGDLAPVFDAILDKAHSLCAVAYGSLQLYDGEKFRAVAVHGLSEAFADRLREGVALGPNMPSRHLLEGARFSHIRDLAEIDDPLARAGFELSGIRTTLAVALRKDGRLLGSIVAARREVRPFTEKEIALLESFAAQAVIAMENARLITETREALAQQTATAEVLRVINSSPGDIVPVFDAMLDKALRLCDAAFGKLIIHEGERRFRSVAERAIPEPYSKFLAGKRLIYGPGTGPDRILEGAELVHTPDLRDEEPYRAGEPHRRALVELGGARTSLQVPLRKDNALLGIIDIYRQEVRPFSDKQIALVQNFAAQAVIAMENARLLDELHQRTADLARSVDELTATSDVLKTISRSSVDLETVLDTLVETVARLCRADQSHMFRRRDDKYHLVAACGLTEEAKRFILAHPFAQDRGTVAGRVALERRAIHIADVLQDPEFTYREGQKLARARTMLGIPLLREETLIGIFIVSRTRVDPFTAKEIELATSFADQAVIAIENARLFEELRERQAELRVTFDNMGDGVAMFDAAARLVAWNRNFQQMLDLPDAFLAARPRLADYIRYLAERGEYSADLEEELSRGAEDTSLEMRFERTRPDGRVIEVRRNPVPGGGFVVIFSDITERKRAEGAVRAARDAAETALRELQTAQASLVHAQKMAALGQLTAGIAHEIKNPLNFVNNFAGLSVELLDELKDAAAQAMSALDADKRAEIVETIGMLTSNLEKIGEHGRRADGIVRSMLQHSRGGSGDWQSTDLNALVEEAMHLAYHGARAQDQSFNIALERDFDRELAPIEVVPQEVTRVFLNLIGNGFYAANKRSRAGDGTFRPVLTVTTRELGAAVEIRVRDNGVGIAAEHREKLFQPFFTTKPTGEGTGLGLSISYEIVTQRHGGTITVDSEVDRFTEFTVRLPRRRRSPEGRAAQAFS
jgi:PAS domain S-box-containing protein